MSWYLAPNISVPAELTDSSVWIGSSLLISHSYDQCDAQWLDTRRRFIDEGLRRVFALDTFLRHSLGFSSFGVALVEDHGLNGKGIVINDAGTLKGTDGCTGPR